MKNKFRSLVLVGLFGCISFFSFTSNIENPVLNKLVTSLQRWTDSIPQEKVYLHMDKPYYALGDTIWFKGYLTIGSRHQLSKLSGAVYVDLISEKDSILQQLKLPVTSGMVMGNLILKDDYHQGSYRLRAYTQWMRNAGEDYFFDHTFLVGDIAGGDIVAKADFSYRDDKGKKTLTALLNYTNEQGKALGEKDVRYEIWVNHKPLWQQNGKTDALGSLRVTIPDDIKQHPEGAYLHTILQGNDKYPATRDFPIKATLTQSDIQFFPESGNLVNSLTSRVGFKAVGIDGLGIHLKGRVTDNDKQEVARFETLHAGMGSFLMTPVAGKTYTANIIFDDGTTKTIPLPKPADEGYVLSVYQPNRDSILLRVHASAKMLGSVINLIAHTGGELVFATPFKMDNPITSIWLQKKSFPTGIAQFTLFSAIGEPLNERIAFVRSKDIMQLDVKTAKSAYSSKELVQVELTAKDGKGTPTAGNFSVSVIDESKVPFDENKESTIFSNLLLKSDLKGYIEESNYYFAKQGDDIDKALDNLMLTQGYRRFAWKDINNTTQAKPKYAVEGWGSSISGTVTTLGHKVLSGAKVDLISIKARVAKNTTTDALGRFSFDNLFITDSIKITIQARNQTKTGLSDKVILTLDSLPSTKASANKNWPEVSTNIGGVLKAYLTAAKKEDDLYEKMGLLDKMHRLREVNITAKKLAIADASITPQGIFKIKEQSADQIINVDPNEASHYTNLAQYLQARIQGVQISTGQYGSTLNLLQGNSTFRSSLRNSGQPVTLYIDGRKIDQPDAVAEALDSSYDPQDIAKIEVVHSNQATINFLGGPAVLILTKLGTSRKAGYNPSVANITPKGFNMVREFYLPKYDGPKANLKEPDLRSSIYWNSYLKTDAQGKSAFIFYNADGPGTYRLVVEGINTDGELGRQVFRYTVAGGQPSADIASSPVQNDKTLLGITTSIDSYNRRLPVEKVYLHTDKPYYSIGDTLWFKGYLLNGVNLRAAKQSGILYVEMDDDSARVVRRISMPIKEGLCSGQIPLKDQVFKEGGYTLRAYTNWMQNFNGAYIFTQRFYIGLPSVKGWLVNSASKIQKVDNKDQLQANLKLSHTNDPSRPVAYQKVEVKVYDEWHYLSTQEMQTGADGSLNITQNLDAKADGRRIRVQITSLNKDDHFMVTQVPIIVNRPQNIDLQFMPESGNLVAGIKSVVGFKAVGEDGKAVAVAGDIFDSKNNKVASFMPLHQGMGTFEFKPSEGEAYTAKIIKPTLKIFPLPRVKQKGVVMHIINAEQSDDIKIDLSGLSSLAVDSVGYLIGTSRGVTYYTQRVDANKPYLSVPKSTFPSGVARFTFFKGRMPLAERAVFVDNHDRLNINLIPNKNVYLKRDSVGLEIQVKDKNGSPVSGNFSLAVTDDSQVKPDTVGDNDITTSLLLNADLKGTIESPGYYINRQDKQAWRALDNLMLTQGWEGYDWNELFAPAKRVKYRAEQPFTINGQVTNVTKKPLPNTKIRLTSLRPPLMTEVTSDINGLFTFTNLPHVDSAAYLLQALNDKDEAKSTGEVTVDRFKLAIEPRVSSTLSLPWYVNADTVQLNLVKNKVAVAKDDFEVSGRLLNEVKINSTKIIPQSRNVFGPGGSDMVFDRKDIKESGAINLYELLAQKLPGFKVIGSWIVNFRGEQEVLPILSFAGYSIDLRIDGWPLPLGLDLTGPDNMIPGVQANSIKDIIAFPIQGPGRAKIIWFQNPSDVIDALSNYKIEGFMGLEVAYTNKNTSRAGYQPDKWAHVEITTSSGKGWYHNISPASITYRPLPLVKPKLFYSPRYNIVSPIKIPDFRSTIFWEPNIFTDRNGRAQVSFYTTDIKSSYTIKIEGIDANGELGANILIINKSK